MKNKIILINTSLLIILMVIFSGCAREESLKNDKNVNQKEISDGQIDEDSNKDIDINAENIPEEELISDIDTSNWLTYSNDEYSFEFSYPKEWNYIIGDSGIIQLSDGKKHYYEGSEIYLISVSINDISRSFSLNEWINNKLSRGGTVKRIMIDKIFAVQGSDYLGVYTIIDSNKKRFFITKVNVTTENTDEIYRGILNSWKFIN